MIINNFVAHR